jgi:hypothetical protein
MLLCHGPLPFLFGRWLSQVGSSHRALALCFDSLMCVTHMWHICLLHYIFVWQGTPLFSRISCIVMGRVNSCPCVPRQRFVLLQLLNCQGTLEHACTACMS